MYLDVGVNGLVRGLLGDEELESFVFYFGCGGPDVLLTHGGGVHSTIEFNRVLITTCF